MVDLFRDDVVAQIDALIADVDGGAGDQTIRPGEVDAPGWEICYPKRMTYQLIRYETSDGIAQITLNRPEKLNAWTPQMAVEQADAIGRANDDRSVGAIVMTGAGRAFCAGADMELTFKSRIDGRDPGEDTASAARAATSARRASAEISASAARRARSRSRRSTPAPPLAPGAASSARRPPGCRGRPGGAP